MHKKFSPLLNQSENFIYFWVILKNINGIFRRPMTRCLIPSE